MASFAELMSRPLPSKSNVDELSAVLEEAEDTLASISMGLSDDGDEESIDGPDTSDMDMDDDADDMLDGLDEDDLNDLEHELVSDTLTGDTDDAIDEIDDEDDPSVAPVSLTPEEEVEADNMMSVAATSALINSEMTTDQKKDLLESSSDLEIAINEGLMLESDIDTIRESVMPIDDDGLEAFTESRFSAKTKVKFSIKDRMSQLWSLAVLISARQHNDPDYIKLQKVYRMKRILRKKLAQKYRGEATKRMKVYIKRLKSSKSGTFKNMGNKITKK